MRHVIDADMASHWADVLEREADGLDLTDTSDRVRFRLRLLHLTQRTRVDLLRALASHRGATNIGTTRGKATRALADTYIQDKT